MRLISAHGSPKKHPTVVSVLKHERGCENSMWLWLKKPVLTWNPKWKHGLPKTCGNRPSDRLILSHTHAFIERQAVTQTRPQDVKSASAPAARSRPSPRTVALFPLLFVGGPPPEARIKSSQSNLLLGMRRSRDLEPQNGWSSFWISFATHKTKNGINLLTLSSQSCRALFWEAHDRKSESSEIWHPSFGALELWRQFPVKKNMVRVTLNSLSCKGQTNSFWLAPQKVLLQCPRGSK